MKKIKKTSTKPLKSVEQSEKAAKSKSKRQKNKRHHLKHHPLLTFFRVVRNGLKNLWRNAWLSIAAISIMSVTLTTILLAVLANKGLNDTIEEYSNDLTLSVYLVDDSTATRQDELRTDLRQNSLVTGVEFVSKDDAKEEFQANYKDEDGLEDVFEIAGYNPLQASFRLNISDLDRIDEIVSFVEQDTYTDVVDDTSNENKVAREAIDQYTSQQKLIILTGMVIAVVFAVISVMVIFNTIRLAIYSRSDEVRTMKLLGASHGYIRGPFLFEAAMYGVVSGLISFGSVAFALKVLVPKLLDSSFSSEGLATSLNKYAIPFFDIHWAVLLGATVAGGVVIGFVSSAMALSRYMRHA